MTRTHRRRPGITLTEVLVAMFVMAIGLIALLTLFPLGAMQIGQSLKDDRCSQASAQADSYVRAYWRANAVEANNDPVLATALSNPDNNLGGAANTNHPLYGLNQLVAATSQMPAVTGAGQPSYPVLIDPLGYQARQSGNPERFWTARRSVAGLTATTLLPRRSFHEPSPLPIYAPLGYRAFNVNESIRTCSMLDDLTFSDNGASDGPTTANPTQPVVRQGRYNWSAVVQRPRNDVPHVATLTVLVFDGRPALLATSGGGDAVTDEVMTPVGITVGDRSITNLTLAVRSGETAPLLRKGGWLMDGTIGPVSLYQTPPGPPTIPTEGVHFVNVRTANFYRIAGVTEVSNDGIQAIYNLDLETPFKPLWNGRSTYSDTGAPISYTAQLYFFAGLAEVFDRPVLQPDAPHQP